MLYNVLYLYCSTSKGNLPSVSRKVVNSSAGREQTYREYCSPMIYREIWNAVLQYSDLWSFQFRILATFLKCKTFLELRLFNYLSSFSKYFIRAIHQLLYVIYVFRSERSACAALGRQMQNVVTSDSGP